MATTLLNIFAATCYKSFGNVMAATRWGCLGPGKISEDFFMAIKENLPAQEHKFVAVASRDLARAHTFADRFGFERAYGSYEEVGQDSDVEVVYIGTLHVTHVDLALKMMHAGKHVLCEKPMAMNLKQAQLVLDAAKTENRLFVEAVWSRWFPAYQKVREELAAGAIGDPRLVLVNFCVPISEVERVKNIAMGGGGCLDIGIYVVQLACMVFNERPVSISAVGNLMGAVDESAVIVLKYKGGGLANLTYHTAAGRGTNSATIMGPKGQIQIESPFHAPTRVLTPTGTNEFPLKEGSYHFGNSAGLQYEATEIRRCLLEGAIESPAFAHKDSVMVHTIMDEVRRQIGVVYPGFD
ncbi:trans-1,2-dihydrobenzene-1,2-diol dehydrogenase-like isoform X3 [Dreissena polymorpha]|uniref:trans-1,2-dihydrobenzene-1,2-diol dehydrogenase-like isoform X3 n=2 Tax=Dreissena polymorpha TaxID=45954 RepID=UPI002263DF29|nr:trans-1,2-dihydrobenzene-1,2-diol dehydrogenase-like isoform X3 [Dreissena polymorpha]